MLDHRPLEIRAVVAADDAATPDLPGPPGELRVCGGRMGRELAAGRSAIAADGLDGDRLAAFAEGLILGAFRLGHERAARPTLVELAGVTDEDALVLARRQAGATLWARVLANTGADRKTPAWLGQQAERGLGTRGVEVATRDVAWLREHGFGGVLAVGGGAAAPPRLIEAAWRPRGARKDVHLVLIGKGITFDTGGINRKAGDGMRTMHTDMSGGAAVLAALQIVADAKLPIRVSALVPAAENALSGSAYRPGDVIRHVGGRTSEIGNTDAEGRVVLADALAWAAAHLRPTAMVDIATLTGAMKVALGMRIGGLFATTDELADGLLAAGESTGEPLWRLPMPADYESALASDVADAGNAPGNPGGITAALYLRPFAGDVPWAHLDVAGPARTPEADGMLSQGATGFGARLLAAWVQAQA